MSLADNNRACLNEIELTYIVIFALTVLIALISVVFLYELKDEFKLLRHRKNQWLLTLEDLENKFEGQQNEEIVEHTGKGRFIRLKVDAPKLV